MDYGVDEQLLNELVERAMNLSMNYQADILSDITSDFEHESRIYYQEPAAVEEDQQERQVLADDIHIRTYEELNENNVLSIELSYAENSEPIVHRPRFRYQKAMKLDPQEQRRREYATKMALENHLVDTIYPYGYRIPTMMQLGYIMMPFSLRKLSEFIKQPQVLNQHELGTCGSRSVANALALSDVLAHGMPLESENIQIMAQKYEKLHTQNGMTSRDQINMARRFDLHNTYALAFFKNDPLDNKKVNPFPFTVIESTELPVVNLYRESEILEEIVRSIRMQKNIVANFLCHLDGSVGQRGHSVVVSIVKRAGNPTQMIYMDSNNLPIIRNSQVAAYICYLYWQCVA